LPLGCGPPNGDAQPLLPQRKPSNDRCLNVDEILPDGWEFAGSDRLDTNHHGKEEWIVLYQFDLPERETSGSPIGAVIYQLDGTPVPGITAYDLRLPDGDYLCECDCRFDLEDVLSGLEGDELVFKDRCNEERSRLSIFQWASDESNYVSLGHFTGDHIEIGQNIVTTTTRLPSRAQLVMVETFYPEGKRTYYRPGDQGSRPTYSKKELDFSYGAPEDVCCSPYPEKVVLAFYQDYKNDEKAPAYFSDRAREYFGQCDTGGCGCRAPRNQIAHVRVTDLQWEGPAADDADEAFVRATITCELLGGGEEEKDRPIRWRLIHEDGRWRLERPG
jgi:hypothetical protein